MQTTAHAKKTPVAQPEKAPALEAGVYLTTPEAAEYLRLSKQFLEGARYRADGSGPSYIKLKHAVRYRRSALDEWMTAHDHSSDKPAGGTL
jgi:predicted DNA-binding transcriptional regulator AlpA